MYKIYLKILAVIAISGTLIAAPEGGRLSTGFVFQKWTIENVTNPVSEGSFPIELIYPFMDNLQVQVSHLPALSQFGESNLAGLSDTWIRTSYSLMNNQLALSLGVGLPTGKTELDSTEILITQLISQNSFKFRLPVFGQGLTLSGGVMYALPVNDLFTVGIGANYVYRGQYKFSKLSPFEYDPGDQIGGNIGFDYSINPSLTASLDCVYSYYLADKLDKTEVFTSGPNFTIKLFTQYKLDFGDLWLNAFYRAKSRNETWDGQALAPEAKNSNVTLREVELGSRIRLNEIVFINVLTELRTYAKNEYDTGSITIFGGGIGYDLSVTRNFALSMGIKLFFGNGEFFNTTPSLTGNEFYFGTQWYF
ncbi:MAG: hypothetical protein ACOY90_17280 [Candidatus Zhuqueibacterota bacterium]